MFEICIKNKQGKKKKKRESKRSCYKSFIKMFIIEFILTFFSMICIYFTVVNVQLIMLGHSYRAFTKLLALGTQKE